MRALRTLLAMLAVLVGLPAVAHAATDTFTVNSTADAHDANVGDGACVAAAPASGKCTLRAAIEEADENGHDTIVNLPAGTYALTFGSLFIDANVDIRGAGAATTIIDGSGMDDSNGPIFGGSEFTLTLEDLTVTKGRNGAVAGSIDTLDLERAAVTHNAGDPVISLSTESGPTLVADHSQISDNSGGAIIDLGGLGDGVMTLRDSEFSRNHTTSGEQGFPTMIDFESTGHAADLTIERSTLADNTLDGPGESNGVIDFNPSNRENLTSRVTIADSTFSDNKLGSSGLGVLQVDPSAGVSGPTAVTIAGSTFSGNVGGTDGFGFGGAIGFYPADRQNAAQTMSITDSSFLGNVAGAADGGVGGAIDWSPSNLTAKLTVRGSTFAANRAGVDGGRSGGQGGAIEFQFGSMDIANTTFTGNRAISSVRGAGGGAVDMYDNTSTATFTNVTMVDNSITGAGRGGGIFVAPPGTDRGAQAAPGESPAVFTDSIVAGNTADEQPVLTRGAAAAAVKEDCFGPIASGGHDIEGAKTCAFDQAGDRQDTDPHVAPLADNGGPTQTRAIGKDSPAFDAGDDATCLKTDQRGVSRPQFAHCDTGAFELQVPPPAPTPTPTPQSSPPPPQGGVAGETQHKCVSRRHFRIRLRVPRGARVVSSVVFVNGRRVAVRHGKRLTAAVNLRKLPKGRFRVKIVLTLADGRKVVGVRRYHTCHRAIPPKRVPRV